MADKPDHIEISISPPRGRSRHRHIGTAPSNRQPGTSPPGLAADGRAAYRRMSRHSSAVFIIRPDPPQDGVSFFNALTDIPAIAFSGSSSLPHHLQHSTATQNNSSHKHLDAESPATADDNDSTAPLLPAPRPGTQMEVTSEWETGSDFDEEDSKLWWAVNLSLIGNIALLLVKAYAFAVSGSFAVLAALADSGVDLASQIVLYFCNRAISRLDQRYPVGRTRLETVGVILCAIIMALSSTEVVQTSLSTLWAAFSSGELPEIGMSWLMYTILGVATGVKVFLYFLCIALAAKSSSAMALAEDHRNDILSNTVAITTAAVASNYRDVWWVDPVGAILISCYIVWSWVSIAKEQMNQMVGLGASEDYIQFLMQLASVHDAELKLDEVRAYHFGARFIVEMEVVMPADMSVRESHDIALHLQHKVEALDEVERAFVHVDYVERETPEHKVERNLQSGSKNLLRAHDSVRYQVPKFNAPDAMGPTSNGATGSLRKTQSHVAPAPESLLASSSSI